MAREGTRGAMLAAVYAGVAFGIFWIPIRALEEAGLSGAWASLAFTLPAALLTLPIYWTRRGELAGRNRLGLLGGALGGVAFGLYALAFLHTDIVRAVLLFYLTPIWGFVLGRIVLGERITPLRWLAVILGFTGIGVIFGLESGLPLPRNAGDWIALASGLFWAVASLLILLDEEVSVAVHGANFFLFSALLNGLAVAVSGGIVPLGEAIPEVLPWLVPVTLALTVPTGFATIYGPTRLSPGVVGLLFMAEVAVAAISAAILTDEAFGMREAIGVVLILGAGLLVPLGEARRAQG